jgi:predicted RNase H-like nuclease
MQIAGVDGCRGGWVVVTAAIDAGDSTVERVARLDALIERVRAGDVHTAGIDMPIGLPTHTRRVSDTQLRIHLGNRRSSVFPTPPRAVLDAVDYRDALERARDATGVGLSKQAWNLVAKIRELDALMTPDLQPRVSEAHPESSFVELAGSPLRTRKSTPEGREERIQLLSRSFPDVEEHLGRNRAMAVDVLDAFAAAWTARRVATGTARWFGDDARDARGLACGKRVAQRLGHLRHVGIVVVAKARPEEPPQPIFSIAGHDVDVKMGHALAYPIVHRDERAGGAEATLDRPADALHLREERLEQAIGEIAQRLVVISGDDEGVAVEHRRSVEEGQRVFSARDDHHLDPPLDDVAEPAPRDRHGRRS